MGQYFRFIQGIDGPVPLDSQAILTRPILTAKFVSIRSMGRHKQARRLAKRDVPPALATPPRVRVGGPFQQDYFQKGGLGETATVIKNTTEDEKTAFPC
nr:hypothetical protein [Amylibacter sp.]